MSVLNLIFSYSIYHICLRCSHDKNTSSDHRMVAPLKSTERRNISGFRAGKRKISAQGRGTSVVQSQTELDSHANTIVCGLNCIIMHYTGKECDVSPYTDTYEAIKSVPIVQAGTAYNNAETGDTLILVFNEAIWMGDKMDHTLVNPKSVEILWDHCSRQPIGCSTNVYIHRRKRI